MQKSYQIYCKWKNAKFTYIKKEHENKLKTDCTNSQIISTFVVRNRLIYLNHSLEIFF